MGNGFKPYYKWITFNTQWQIIQSLYSQSFKPYYKWITFNTNWLIKLFIYIIRVVLNLIINGLPSIQLVDDLIVISAYRFKPYYKWITFNTETGKTIKMARYAVLNLIINGLPSIQNFPLMIGI